MKHSYYTTDVFTDQLFFGNPLSVFPDAGSIDESKMQLIAKEFNLSETVFVLPAESPKNQFRLKIFTPRRELPFAGHPTVGAACLLASVDRVDMSEGHAEIVLEEVVGEVPVDIAKIDDEPFHATFSSPRMVEYLPGAPNPTVIAQSLSLQSSNILSGNLGPTIASCGTPYLMVALDSIDTLQAIRVDPGKWEESIASCPAPAMYTYAFSSDSSDSNLQARMFAPSLGTPEDPATGGAATALAGMLADLYGGESSVVKRMILQGKEMGRPSKIHIETIREQGLTRQIRVGGHAVTVSKGEFDLI